MSDGELLRQDIHQDIHKDDRPIYDLGAQGRHDHNSPPDFHEELETMLDLPPTDHDLEVSIKDAIILGPRHNFSDSDYAKKMDSFFADFVSALVTSGYQIGSFYQGMAALSLDNKPAEFADVLLDDGKMIPDYAKTPRPRVIIRDFKRSNRLIVSLLEGLMEDRNIESDRLIEYGSDREYRFVMAREG
jgi:hypothetical protein